MILWKNGWRDKLRTDKNIFNWYNQKKAEELDWTPSKRQLSTEGDSGGKDGGKRGRGRPKQNLKDWMMEDVYGKRM